MTITARATVEDLYNVPENGKAELVNGELVIMGATGMMPGRAGSKILISLYRHEEEQGGGYTFGDKVGFIVHLPHRESFSPDVAWYVGDVNSMRFAEGAPRFAVEVRSENDYGPGAERAIAAKIRDYFDAGTLVVWDVDLQRDDVIKKYAAGSPDTPTICRRAETADAEPAVPGWRFPVATLFR